MKNEHTDSKENKPFGSDFRAALLGALLSTPVGVGIAYVTEFDSLEMKEIVSNHKNDLTKMFHVQTQDTGNTTANDCKKAEPQNAQSFGATPKTAKNEPAAPGCR